MTYSVSTVDGSAGFKGTTVDWLRSVMKQEEREITHCPICGKESHLCKCPVIDRGLFAKYVDKREEIQKKIYDIVLAARTEGIVGGKTKYLADEDASAILQYLHENNVVIRGRKVLCSEGDLYQVEPLIQGER